MTEDLPFKISSSLKNIIGRDLITDDFIAVYELVKNAYDAHASRVKIVFSSDSIAIVDNGKGMNYEDLKNKWLFVAYSAKRDGTEDKELQSPTFKDYRDNIALRKHFAGAKGIGRFSCDRLGGKLTLLTKKVGESSRAHKLEVDWKKFEVDAEQEFEQIEVSYAEIDPIELGTTGHGTILKITALNSLWDYDKIKRLKHSLEKLINPFDNDSSQDGELQFEIDIEASEWIETDRIQDIERNKVNGPIKNFIFETLKVKTTEIKVEISGDDIWVQLLDRGQLIYEIKELNLEYQMLAKELTKISFHVFFLNRAAKRNFTTLMGMQPVKFGSIFLFKNGFRVLPYGEFGVDLWGLDSRKSQAYARRLGTRDIIGRVELFGDSHAFREVSSRDGGLVKTSEYDLLVQSFFKKCLERLERYVVDIQWAYVEDPELIDDKNRDDLTLLDNIGAKTRIIRLISNLVANKEIELISYNKDFLNILGERIEEAPPEVFRQLAKLAESTNDLEFAQTVREIEERYQRLKEEKEQAEEVARLAEEELKKAEQERDLAVAAQKDAEEYAELESLARREAELKLAEEALKKKEAELRASEEVRLRKKAELLLLEEEQEKKNAELRAAEAELLAREEALKAREAEDRQKEAEAEVERARRENELKNSQVNFLESVQSLELKDVLNIHHQVGIDANNIDLNLRKFRLKVDKNPNVSEADIRDIIDKISFLTQKILAVTKFTTKRGFLKTTRSVKSDIISFTKKYIQSIYFLSHGKRLDVEFFADLDASYIREFKPIEVSIVIDNLLSNSEKNFAKNVKFIFDTTSFEGKLAIIVEDDGAGLPDALTDPNEVFKRGFTTTDGSGLGLYHVKKIITDMKGTIDAYRVSPTGFRIKIVM